MCNTVIYTLTEADAAKLNARRTDLKAGESFPAVLVRKFGEGEGSRANLQVHVGEALGEVTSDPLENPEPCQDYMWAQGVECRLGRAPGTWEPIVL